MSLFYILLLLVVICMLASQMKVLCYQIALVWELHISPMGFEMMFLIVKPVYEMERRTAKERNKSSFHFKKWDKLLTCTGTSYQTPITATTPINIVIYHHHIK